MRKWFYLLIILIPFGCAEKKVNTSNLGSITFPNSGAEEAQGAFLNGVMALHNYWYEEAEEQFIKAREIDPDFAMAYWGQAMTKNKTLWQIQDREAALEILSELGSGPNDWVEKAALPEEKRFLESLSILYDSTDDKLQKDLEYRDYMKAFMLDYPENDEVKAFYALALLGVLRDNQGNEKVRMECGALAQEILDENPDHPGALHYLIHAMDDPLHARIALNAAYRYAEVAPASHHARHMPSHIFVQLGMWDRVVKSNISAYEASINWATDKKLGKIKYDRHSLAWMTYGYEMKGRFDKALENLNQIQKDNADTSNRYSRRYEVSMISRLFVETGMSDSLELKLSFDSVKGWTRRPWYFANALGSLNSDSEYFEDWLIKLEGLKLENLEEGKAFESKLDEIHISALRGYEAFLNGDEEKFNENFKSGIEIEESLNPPTGPPDMIKPIHEWYGELLLELGEAEKAIPYFAIQLERTPNRSPSRLGIARALAISGDLRASKTNYQAFAANYSQAQDHPFFLEAKAFLLAYPDSIIQSESKPYVFEKPQVFYDRKLKITECPDPT